MEDSPAADNRSPEAGIHEAGKPAAGIREADSPPVGIPAAHIPGERTPAAGRRSWRGPLEDNLIVTTDRVGRNTTTIIIMRNNATKMSIYCIRLETVP